MLLRMTLLAHFGCSSSSLLILSISPDRGRPGQPTSIAIALDRAETSISVDYGAPDRSRVAMPSFSARLGAHRLSGCQIEEPGLITANVPALPAGTYDLAVTDGRGRTGVKAAAYTATDDPAVLEEDAGVSAGQVDDAGGPVVVALSVDGGPATDGAVLLGPPPDYCASIPARQGAPVIDGTLDYQDLALESISSAPWVAGETVPPGNAARFAVAWLPAALYIYIEVDDPERRPAPLDAQPWAGDGVSLYLDSDARLVNPPLYDMPGTVQLVVSAPVDEVTPSTRSEVYVQTSTRGPWMSSRFRAVPRSGGYNFEALITGADLMLSGAWLLASGSRIGFDFSINASGAEGVPGRDRMGGTRVGEYGLNIKRSQGGCPGPWCDATMLCTPVLGAR